MDSTLTIRLPSSQRQALQTRAKAVKKTEAALVRELIEREIRVQTFAEKATAWKHGLDSSSARLKSDDWQKAIRARNWRSQ